MSNIQVQSKSGPITFKISGDEPTPVETLRIQKQLRRINREAAPVSLMKSEDSDLFDTTTGIQDAGFRAALSVVDTFDEKQKY